MKIQTENKKFNIRKNLMKSSFGAMLMLSAYNISTDAFGVGPEDLIDDQLLKFSKHNLPKDLPRGFSGRAYINLYPDLQRATSNLNSIEKELWGRRHYVFHGRNEGRACEEIPHTIDTWFVNLN